MDFNYFGLLAENFAISTWVDYLLSSSVSSHVIHVMFAFEDGLWYELKFFVIACHIERLRVTRDTLHKLQFLISFVN